jgi:hypothetical protein
MIPFRKAAHILLFFCLVLGFPYIAKAAYHTRCESRRLFP